MEKLEHGFYRITARYGFMEQPNVPEILQWAREAGIKAKTNDTTFYLGRERIIISDGERRSRARAARRTSWCCRTWRAGERSSSS